MGSGQQRNGSKWATAWRRASAQVKAIAPFAAWPLGVFLGTWALYGMIFIPLALGDQVSEATMWAAAGVFGGTAGLGGTMLAVADAARRANPPSKLAIHARHQDDQTIALAVVNAGQRDLWAVGLTLSLPLGSDANAWFTWETTVTSKSSEALADALHESSVLEVVRVGQPLKVLTLRRCRGLQFQAVTTFGKPVAARWTSGPADIAFLHSSI